MSMEIKSQIGKKIINRYNIIIYTKICNDKVSLQMQQKAPLINPYFNQEQKKLIY